jgi:hypothetical protein
MVPSCTYVYHGTKQNAERLYGVGAILDAEDPACCAGMYDLTVEFDYLNLYLQLHSSKACAMRPHASVHMLRVHTMLVVTPVDIELFRQL